MTLRIIRLLLLPLTFLYGLIAFIRNYLYDKNIFSIYKIPIKSICVGNLSTGGTGKSPFILYLTELYKDKYKIAILSRGYGRNTKGYIEVNKNKNSIEVGDEPFMFFKNFGNYVKIAVCEDRKTGIQNLIQNHNVELLLLDDAFQHRKVKAGFTILLNDFNNAIHNDFLLPTGNLRESKKNYNRSDLMLVTKCPKKLSDLEKKHFIKSYNFNPDNIFFSHIFYNDFIPFFKSEFLNAKVIILVTGIANPTQILEYLKTKYDVHLIKFPDHHEFKIKDIEEIHNKFNTFASCDVRIVCTEKDYVRFIRFFGNNEMEKYPWFYLPIKIKIDREKEFLNKIDNYVRNF